MAELIDLCNKIFTEEINKIESIKLEYSHKLKILYVFTNNFIYIIDNSKNNPNLILKSKINFEIKSISIHPKSQNQLLIITKKEKILLIPDLKSFSNMSQIREINLKAQNIISAKFSYFDNYLGILYDHNKFNLYFIKSNSEEILLSEELDTNYIDFHFCPQFSLGFDMFMLIFMTQKGDLNMYGPFFPQEFRVKKEYFFNMNNYLLYKLNLVKNNEFEYQKLAISLAIIDDLKNSIVEETNDDYLIHISEKIQRLNATFKKREIFINNNFLTNDNTNLLKLDYKQIYILENRPLTVLRISENNSIDIIILSDEILPELASIGNIIDKNDMNINNYLIEFIQLNKEKNVQNDLLKFLQYENNKLFIKTNDSLYFVQIPYLNDFKKAVEDNIMFIPNKMKKTSINKILTWNNNKNKVIKINDILIMPELHKFYIFAIFKEKIIEKKQYPIENIKETKKIVIKDMNFKDPLINSDKMKFKDIYKTEQKDNFGMGLYDVKLSENDTIKNKIKNHKININEKLLEDKEKKDKFESELNEDMGKMFKIYDNLLENNDKNFFNKIAIMKNIYNNLSNSKIKENIDETNKKILGLKTLKEKISKNNELITKKIDIINEKINKYELTDEATEQYLKILKKYQKDLDDRLRNIETTIKKCDENIAKNYLFMDLFPKNDLGFDLIEKDNQQKYIKIEEEINAKSKELCIKIQK
jgi:hypothetical protein